MTSRLPGDLLERPPEEAIRLLCLKFLQEATDARVRLDDPQDHEALHDFRVAIRRLRSTCRVYRPYLESSLSKKLRRALRDLTVVTNAGRDAEVMLSWVETLPAERKSHETETLILKLRDRKSEGRERVAADVLEPFDQLAPRLRERLGKYRMTVHLQARPRRTRFGRVAGAAIHELATELRHHLQAVHGPGDVLEAHQARIAGKRLRYVLEPLVGRSKRAQALVRALKDLQDILGEMRDAQVARQEIALLPRDETSPDPSRESPLAAAAEARLAHLFTRLEESWLGGRVDALLERIDRFGSTLRNRRRANVEVERKYLLNGLPDAVRGKSPQEIDQGWIPGDVVAERVRRTRQEGTENYVRTVKLGAGVTRSEFEEPASRETFEALWPLTANHRVSKRRYVIPDEGHTWEIDEFTDRELFLAEIELDAEDEAVSIPAWLAPYVVREVTGEAEYVNANLAR